MILAVAVLARHTPSDYSHATLTASGGGLSSGRSQSLDGTRLLPGRQGSFKQGLGLGEPGRISQVYLDGQSVDLSPLPERKPLAGWRMPSMGQQLTRDFALSGAGQQLHSQPEEL